MFLHTPVYKYWNPYRYRDARCMHCSTTGIHRQRYGIPSRARHAATVDEYENDVPLYGGRIRDSRSVGSTVSDCSSSRSRGTRHWFKNLGMRCVARKIALRLHARSRLLHLRWTPFSQRDILLQPAHLLSQRVQNALAGTICVRLEREHD